MPCWPCQSGISLVKFKNNEMDPQIGLFCDSFPPIMDGVSVCMQNYAHWMQKKVGNVTVVTPHKNNAH